MSVAPMMGMSSSVSTRSASSKVHSKSFNGISDNFDGLTKRRSLPERRGEVKMVSGEKENNDTNNKDWSALKAKKRCRHVRPSNSDSPSRQIKRRKIANTRTLLPDCIVKLSPVESRQTTPVKKFGEGSPYGNSDMDRSTAHQRLKLKATKTLFPTGTDVKENGDEATESERSKRESKRGGGKRSLNKPVKIGVEPKRLEERDIHHGRNSTLATGPLDEMDVDYTWLDKMSHRQLDEFVDLNEGEKEFFKLWNRFQFEWPCVGVTLMPDSLDKFVDLCSSDIMSLGLYKNLVLHLANLHHFGIISPVTMAHVLAKFHQTASDAEQYDSHYMLQSHMSDVVGLRQSQHSPLLTQNLLQETHQSRRARVRTAEDVGAFVTSHHPSKQALPNQYTTRLRRRQSSVIDGGQNSRDVDYSSKICHRSGVPPSPISKSTANSKLQNCDRSSPGSRNSIRISPATNTTCVR